MGNSQPPPSPPPVKLEGKKNLLLVGKAGNGKSSTGNTILGQQNFYIEDCGSAVTLSATLAKAMFNGHILKIVDTAGVRDPRVHEGEQKERAVRNINEGFIECRDGFHAVLVVMHYGSRFSKEDQEVIDLLVEIFGIDILRKHGIVAFTRGEDFFKAHGQDARFIDWLSKQEGGLRDLIQECSDRVVLFSNRNIGQGQNSRDRLFEYLNSMRGVFTNDKFRANSDTK